MGCGGSSGTGALAGAAAGAGAAACVAVPLPGMTGSSMGAGSGTGRGRLGCSAGGGGCALGRTAAMRGDRSCATDCAASCGWRKAEGQMGAGWVLKLQDQGWERRATGPVPAGPGFTHAPTHPQLGAAPGRLGAWGLGRVVQRHRELEVQLLACVVEREGRVGCYNRGPSLNASPERRPSTHCRLTVYNSSAPCSSVPRRASRAASAALRSANLAKPKRREVPGWVHAGRSVEPWGGGGGWMRMGRWVLPAEGFHTPTSSS